MKELIWIDKDNLKNDKLIDCKVVKLYRKNGELYSHHIVEKYRVKSGEFENNEYYLFRLKDGKSVMNYNSEDYYELSRYLNISLKYQIFMTYEIDGPDDFGPIPVSTEYRLSPKWRSLQKNKKELVGIDFLTSSF